MCLPDVDHPCPRSPQQEIEEDGDHYAAEQHIERGQRLRRHHAVIDLHGKDHTGDAQQVRDERGQHHVGVEPGIAQHQPPQPVGLVGLDVLVHA